MKLAILLFGPLLVLGSKAQLSLLAPPLSRAGASSSNPLVKSSQSFGVTLLLPHPSPPLPISHPLVLFLANIENNLPDQRRGLSTQSHVDVFERAQDLSYSW